MRNLALLAAVLLGGCFEAAQPTSHVENGKQTRDVLDARVTSCDQLAKEIEDMTQTTAELRKVLRDMEYLTCATGKDPSLRPLQPPDCGANGNAVLVSVGSDGVPAWLCTPK